MLQLTSIKKLKEIGVDGDYRRYKLGELIVNVQLDVTNTIASYRQCSFNKPESGGLFIGVRYKNLIVINQLTTPFPLDISKRGSFTLKDPLHQKIVDAQWRSSNGTINFVGDWHTHPEKIATPSGMDRRYWKKLTKAKFPMIFAIQGTKQIDFYLSSRSF
jgi:integrative and conjugative element protein (TIGR02256 family)